MSPANQVRATTQIGAWPQVPSQPCPLVWPMRYSLREATRRKQALWKAVHHAKLQGVSLRGIAKELGISRNAVRKYVYSPALPVNRTPRRANLRQQFTTMTNGHFP